MRVSEFVCVPVFVFLPSTKSIIKLTSITGIYVPFPDNDNKNEKYLEFVLLNCHPLLTLV